MVADVPQMDARYAAAFAGWDVALAHTMAQARQALAGARCDLVVIGAYFDDSQMFDLVRAIRGDEHLGDMPIVCVRAHPGYTLVAGRTLDLALQALAVDAFIDLPDFGDAAAGNAALRACGERLATGGAAG